MLRVTKFHVQSRLVLNIIRVLRFISRACEQNSLTSHRLIIKVLEYTLQFMGCYVMLQNTVEMENDW